MNEICSIIIPAYNQADKTIRAVESCLKQTYPCEIIVIDDGSTDDTYKKLQTIKGIHYTHQRNQGASVARNVGISWAEGKYIAFLDCDDYYEPDKIERSICFMKAYNYLACHTSACFINKPLIREAICSNEEWWHGFWEYKPKIGNLLFRNYICNSTVVMDRWVIDHVGLYDESLFIAADWDLWLRIEEKFKIGYLDRPLTWKDGGKLEPIYV
jgi:glycosyltransferase involved in cell wall biosynthesis